MQDVYVLCAEVAERADKMPSEMEHRTRAQKI